MARQTSNRLRQPPDVLKELLEGQSLLAADVAMPSVSESAECLRDWWEFGTFDIFERLRSATKEKPKTFELAPPEALKAKSQIDAIFGRLPDSFRKHLRTYADGESEVWDLVCMALGYENFRMLRAELRQIVRVCQRNESLRPIAARVWFGVGAQGQLTAALPRLYKALDGVEASRIRVCQNPKCKQVFWAGRTDKVGCTDSCLQAIRDRRWRENYLEKYKLQRMDRELLTVEKAGKRASGGKHSKDRTRAKKGR